jgi:hypothetical protein
MVFPAWQFEALYQKYVSTHREKAYFADALLPAPSIVRVRRVQGRLAQRIALVRQVEALRLYAAEHKGAFPEKLSDVSVPLPDDPFTGKPFSYELRTGTAHLRGTPPEAEAKNPEYRIHYEITLRD